MQASALFRRGIVVPLDDTAEQDLRDENIYETINVRFLKIQPHLFSRVWISGLFDAINAQCAAMIDDYEEELIEPSSVPGVQKAIDKVISDPAIGDLEVLQFLKDARELANEAHFLSRPMLFVL